MNTVLTGLLIGALAAIAVSSCIAIFQFSSDAPWKELLEMWGKMLVLTIPAFASTTAAALLAWRYRREQPPGLPVVGEAICAPEIALPSEQMSLSDAVVLNAREQAEWHYEWNIEPTRRAFEEQGVSQLVWASGREILKVAGLVSEDRQWAEVTLEKATATLSKIYPEEDRVWVRPLGERTMVALHISPKAVGNKYTSTAPPQSP